MRSIGTHNGFSLIELLITTAVFAFLLVGFTYFLIGQGNSYSGQKNRSSVEDEARATMDFVVRMMRDATLNPAFVITGAACGNTVDFYYTESTGISTGANANNLLNDTTQNWSTNQWAGYTVVLTGGNGSGQTRSIASNTATQFVVGTTWSTIPDNTSIYKIVSDRKLSLAGSTLKYQNVSSGSGIEALSDYITCFTVQPDATCATRYNLWMTAQTANNLPDTGKQGTTTLQSSIDVRN